MKNGDLIKINYEMYVGEEKDLVATNNEKLAKEKDIYNEENHYGPSVLIVGDPNLLSKVNESLLSAEVGKEVEVSMTPEEGFGERDPNKIKVHTYRELKRNNIDPELGKEIILNNRRGKILSVTPGRILVDYNHKYAGKNIIYKYEIIEVLEDPLKKLEGLVDLYYSYKSSQFIFDLKDENINLTIPDSAKFDPLWIEAKYEIVNKFRDLVRDLNLNIIEKYEKLKSEETNEENEEKPSEAENEDQQVTGDEETGETSTGEREENKENQSE